MVKSKQKFIEECATLFDIQVPKEDIARAFDEVYAEMTKVANIPGFRAGKAPKELVAKHYSKTAKEEVLKKLVPEAYRMALEEHGINPIGLPEISEVNFQEDKELSFKARVDTRPKFKIKDYRGIKVNKKKVSVTAEEIDKTLASLRDISATYITVEERPVQMGDYVVSDMECFAEDRPVHKKRENLWLFVDKNSLVPGLSDHMVGMKKGEEKNIEITMPQDYPDKNLAGKPVRYHILAKDIKTRKLAQLNDEFAKGLGKGNLEELKKEISNELEYRAIAFAEIEAENELLNRLADDNVFEVPSSFVKRQLEYMIADAKKHLVEKGFKKEDLDKKDDELNGKFKSDAVKRVRLLFILDEIARAEGIGVSEEDVAAAYKSISAETGKDEATVKAYYEKEDLADSLKDKIGETKTIKFLLDNAQIMEI